MLHPKLRKTITAIKIMSFLSLMVFVYCAYIIVTGFASGEPYSIQGVLLMVGIGLISLASFIFTDRVIHDLKKKKFWAWFSGVIICSVSLCSPLFPLGIIGLVGLGDKEVRQEYL